MPSLTRKLLLLAVPATLSVAIDPLAATIDTILIGQKNADWLAPFSSSNSILATAVFSLNFLVYTVSARVAQAYGQRDPELLHRETKAALSIAVLIGVLATALLFVAKGPLLSMVMALEGETLVAAESYFGIRLLGLPLALLASAMVGTLRGYQRLTATVWVIGAATIVNAVVSYVCLFIWNTPVWGAALGTSLSFVASVIVGWFALKDCDPMLRFKDLLPFSFEGSGAKWVAIDWQDFGRDALFQLLRSVLLNVAFFSATVMCAQASAQTLGGHQLVYQFMLLVGCFLDGMAVSVSTLGGEAIGERDYRRWQKLVNLSLVLAFGISVIITAIVLATHHEIIALFTSDPAMQQHVADGFHIYAYSIPILGLAYQYDGILFSAKMFREAAIGLAIALALFYVPTLIWPLGLSISTLAQVWLAIGLLGVGRVLSSYYFIRRAYQDDFALVKSYRL